MSRLSIIVALFLFPLTSFAEGIDCLSSCSGKPGYSDCMRCCTPTGFVCHDGADATDPNQYAAPPAPASTSSSTPQTQTASQSSPTNAQTASNGSSQQGSWMQEHQQLNQDRAALAGDIHQTEAAAQAYRAAVKQYGANSPQAQAARAALGKDLSADRAAEHQVGHDQRALAATEGRFGEGDRRERERRERERLERERREARALEHKEHHDQWAANHPGNHPGAAAHPTQQYGSGTSTNHFVTHRPRTQVAKR